MFCIGISEIYIEGPVHVRMGKAQKMEQKILGAQLKSELLPQLSTWKIVSSRFI